MMLTTSRGSDILEEMRAMISHPNVTNRQQLVVCSGHGIIFDHHPLFKKDEDVPEPILRTSLGALFNADCLDILPKLKSETVDTVFADPPFNLGKSYSSEFTDNLSESKYVQWCENWLDECIRVLKPGGTIFVYNLPKWNILLATHLMGKGLTFRDWIAVNIKFGLPIQNRLYPSHYGLIYFTKGKPKTFRNIRTPIETCRHCGGELRDYGGYRDKMNENGVNLTDVWSDIPPVRHRKFKSEKRVTNQLSTKLLDRVVEMSTIKGDLVLDPFGGGGTTFDVCEYRGRQWIGIELYHTEAIIERLQSGGVHRHRNTDYVEGDQTGAY